MLNVGTLLGVLSLDPLYMTILTCIYIYIYM